MSASRIVRLAEIDLWLEPQRWPFAESQADKIAAHWRARQAERPRLFNGRVLVLGPHTLDPCSDGAYALRGACLEVDYASFLAWKDFGFPEASIANCFAAAALLTSDGAFLLGEMAPHTATAGSIYFPAGTPDLKDVFDGRVDLTASVTRELGEETGLGVDDVAFGRDWTLVSDGRYFACLKLMRLAQTAEAAKAHIEAFLAADPEPELARIHIARRPEDVDPRRSPRYVVDFLAFAFAQRLVG